MRDVVLRFPLSPHDLDWDFSLPELAGCNERAGKYLVFTPQELRLRYERLPDNRIIHNDDPKCFIVASFEGLRFSEPYTLGATRDYIRNFFKAGLTLNGVHYRFYHHSNSQLRGRSCFLRQARTDDELDERIYRLGDFKKMNSVAKRAKRIGLLFSGAEVDYTLKPEFTRDIPDIISKEGELFSDGCGLMSRRLAQNVARRKNILFRGARYTPTIFQIRYRAYKGVLMIHPELDKARGSKIDVHFRASMKKFNTTIDNTLSIVDYSHPYTYGRLNSDIVVLLSSLGITNEALQKKQKAYFDLIAAASSNAEAATHLLSCTGRGEMVERLLLDGFEHVNVQNAIRAAQDAEIAAFTKETPRGEQKDRVRMIIPCSRLLFGVCDPTGELLKEGEVHVRITARGGVRSLSQTDVMVIRNPCLHPGDLLKLRAVECRALDHLVDCVVFAAEGKRAAPSMTSGGDLDGDRFTVCWDPDIVPKVLSESYTYPAGRDRISANITRQDLANHFASYSGAGIARIANLHRKWMIATPEGAMSVQCQELNALHSLCVDGGSIKIPQRLENPPEDAAKPFVLDVLATDARAFAQSFARMRMEMEEARSADEDPEMVLKQLLESDVGDQHLAFSEDELVGFVLSAWRRNKVDPYKFLPLINWSGVSAMTKHALYATLLINTVEHPYIWNSLITSDLVQPQDLVSRRLDEPLRLQRLYTSHAHGRPAFFEYLTRAMRDYERKVILVRIDNRITLGIFVRGRYEEEDVLIGENACVCTFEPTAAHVPTTYKPTTVTYRLHWADGLFQLYDKHKGDTFVFIQRPAAGTKADLNISVALQKINSRVQQVGRVNRAELPGVEVHVVSQRDREAQQLFDLRFSHVETEEVLGRLVPDHRPWRKNALKNVNWSDFDGLYRTVFDNPPDVIRPLLMDCTFSLLDELFEFSVTHRAYDYSFTMFSVLLERGVEAEPSIVLAMTKVPPVVYVLFKPRVDGGIEDLPDAVATPDMVTLIVKCIIISADQYGAAAPVALQNLSDKYLEHIPSAQYVQFLWIAANSIRYIELLGDVLLVLFESRQNADPASKYVLKQALMICGDRAQEARENCPCDARGQPTRRRSAGGPPSYVNLIPKAPYKVRIEVRIDFPNLVRNGSHIRLRAGDIATNEAQSSLRITLDGMVDHGNRGELAVTLFQALPPEVEQIPWLMYNAGTTTTSKAMLDAVASLNEDTCALTSIITGEPRLGTDEPETEDRRVSVEDLDINASQRDAILAATSAPLTLIWGPPGSGKTTVVVKILQRLLPTLTGNQKILMAASTHNAVDNVLERFAARTNLPSNRIVRFSTDINKVHKNAQKYTVDAQLGGSPTDDPRLIAKAKRRVAEATIVFSTCAAAGLGLLRDMKNFPIVVVDEASQITEAMTLIPMVKGCKKAILVGDHVQLRPTVKSLARGLEFDVSLLERLYNAPADTTPGVHRVMLDIQYRFPESLCRFPSAEFYGGNLKTGTQNTLDERRAWLRHACPNFPWPRTDEPDNLWIPCDTLEDFGESSKSNEGQAKLAKHIVDLLASDILKVTVLTPYSRQAKLLRELGVADCSTIDGYQGRENDIIVYTTVRCNLEGDVGFLDDPRRLNVAFTRARVARIVVGHAPTLTAQSDLWKRAIHDATTLRIAVAA